MDTNLEQKIKGIFQQQKAFFKTNQTKNIEFRKAQLKKFRDVFLQHTDALCEALNTYLGKSRKEAEYVEIQIVISELDYLLENIDEWAKPTSVPSKPHPSGAEVESKITYQPYGVTYIIGPFNYPVQLTFSPLI